ncbi:MAG: sel1 repeat family protein [Alphaproteobacteria bacterium]|nr:sel1 repeat family protein [Alphaproteobacteria bacterium]MBF0251250.1 sel1 repeat family protein [Alphaproteobacteria bacterium]
MIAFIRALVVCLSATVLFFPPALADEAQEKLLDQALAAYDEGDFEAARSILLPLANAGNSDAMVQIGFMIHNGEAFSPDAEYECDWYERASELENMEGLYHFAHCFHEGVGRDLLPQQYYALLLKSAELGFIPAMINLSGFDDSHGEEYRNWMMMAVEQGSNYARVSLWLQDYRDDVPDIKILDIVCVSWKILILGDGFMACD